MLIALVEHVSAADTNGHFISSCVFFCFFLAIHSIVRHNSVRAKVVGSVHTPIKQPWGIQHVVKQLEPTLHLVDDTHSPFFLTGCMCWSKPVSPPSLTTAVQAEEERGNQTAFITFNEPLLTCVLPCAEPCTVVQYCFISTANPCTPLLHNVVFLVSTVPTLWLHPLTSNFLLWK